LNKKVKENHDFILPEGYYKVTEKDQILNYLLPGYLDIDESQRVTIEVLDSIFSDIIGFHILEPLVTYEQRIKVKPRIKQTSLALGHPSTSYMQPVERKLKPLGIVAKPS
jgi:hypothetical protein